MKDRAYYEVHFAGYPDVVRVKDLAKMLGDVQEATVLKLLKADRILHFKIKNILYIPKVSVIDFMVSEDYDDFWKNVEVARCRTSSDPVERKRYKVLAFCEQPRSAKEILLLLDITSKKTLYRLYIRPLLESGELQRTVPEQACISTQRYIRVKKTHR